MKRQSTQSDEPEQTQKNAAETNDITQSVEPVPVAEAVLVGTEKSQRNTTPLTVPVQVSVDRSLPGPILAPSDSGDGGVQGLKWYAKRLRIDEDGDVADEFIDEVTRESLSMNTEHEKKPLPKFQAKYGTRPAKVQKQVVLHNGRLQQYVEHQGRLQLV
ncbi:hypothetical protein G4B88_014809 [Cannabis sativa]|uniref:Uncharacterized protein n=1 Tax=Cannabis sativa TaxID=3483 RepID=A0A7J6I9U9_CANSA|nr:hypothetical protein G4B88_014809 [Cannabis sativa]